MLTYRLAETSIFYIAVICILLEDAACFYDFVFMRQEMAAAKLAMFACKTDSKLIKIKI